MGGRDDLDKALRAVMASRHEELGEPPTPEELLAYRDGELDPAARQSVEDRLAIDPDAARALADLAAFPEIQPAPGVAELTDEEVEHRWNALYEKLQEEPQRPAAAPAPVPSSSFAPPTIESRRPVRSGWSPALRLAAAAVLALAAGWGGFLFGRASRPSPVNVAVALVELVPLEEGRARSLPLVEVSGAPDEVVVVLGLPAASDLPEYRIEILDAQGTRIWSGGGLHPTPLGTVDLSIRSSALPAGTSLIRLFDAERGSLVAVYELRIAESPERS